MRRYWCRGNHVSYYYVSLKFCLSSSKIFIYNGLQMFQTSRKHMNRWQEMKSTSNRQCRRWTSATDQYSKVYWDGLLILTLKHDGSFGETLPSREIPWWQCQQKQGHVTDVCSRENVPREECDSAIPFLPNATGHCNVSFMIPKCRKIVNFQVLFIAFLTQLKKLQTLANRSHLWSFFFFVKILPKKIMKMKSILWKHCSLCCPWSVGW